MGIPVLYSAYDVVRTYVRTSARVYCTVQYTAFKDHCPETKGMLWEMDGPAIVGQIGLDMHSIAKVRGRRTRGRCSPKLSNGMSQYNGFHPSTALAVDSSYGSNLALDN